MRGQIWNHAQITFSHRKIYLYPWTSPSELRHSSLYITWLQASKMMMILTDSFFTSNCFEWEKMMLAIGSVGWLHRWNDFVCLHWGIFLKGNPKEICLTYEYLMVQLKCLKKLNWYAFLTTFLKVEMTTGRLCEKKHKGSQTFAGDEDKEKNVGCHPLSFERELPKKYRGRKWRRPPVSSCFLLPGCALSHSSFYQETHKDTKTAWQSFNQKKMSHSQKERSFW